MSNRRFEVYQYRQILLRLKAGDSIRSIARDKLADRKKVRSIATAAKQQAWLSGELPTDEVLNNFFRMEHVSENKKKILNYEEQIEKWANQGIQASTIHATLVRDKGYTGSYDTVQRFIKKIKSNILKATMVLDFKPGECAQVDFGMGPKLLDERTGELIPSWIFVMVLCWSRHQYAEIVLHQDVETWLACHRHAFEWFGGVVKKIIIDNPKCAITRACYYDPVVQRAYYDYAEDYGFMISACPPREPQKKGIVESGVKYVKNNFVPLRNFINKVDANKQLQQWVLETAGNRIHGTTKEQPLALFATEQTLLKSLPEKPPEYLTWAKVKLHADCHVTYLKCRYSAPYQFIKQCLWLRATSTTLRIYHDNKLIAVHSRLFKAGSRSTLSEHLPPNAIAYCFHDPQTCLAAAQRIGQGCEQVVKQLLENSVVDFLRAVQGIVGLEKKYSAVRVNAACLRAIHFQSVHYKTISTILKKGLEYAPLPEQIAFDALSGSYTGKSLFCRDTTTILQ